MSEALRVIESRRSVRRYLDTPVDNATIDRLLEAARWAPSAHNKQPWKLAVVSEDESLKREISSLSKYRDWIMRAPCLILVYLDRSTLDDRIFNSELKHHEAIGAAIQNFMLAARALGLGTCWIGEIVRESSAIRALTGTPEVLEFVAMLTLGYPAEDPKPTNRGSIESMVLFRR